MLERYVDWFEVAKTTRLHQLSRGRQYRDGVERAAALAAIRAPWSKTTKIDAIEYEFRRHELLSPSWDGSIA